MRPVGRGAEGQELPPPPQGIEDHPPQQQEDPFFAVGEPPQHQVIDEVNNDFPAPGAPGVVEQHGGRYDEEEDEGQMDGDEAELDPAAALSVTVHDTTWH